MNQPSLTERVQKIETAHFSRERTQPNYQLDYFSALLKLPGKHQPHHQEQTTFALQTYTSHAGYSLRNALYVLSQLKL